MPQTPLSTYLARTNQQLQQRGKSANALAGAGRDEECDHSLEVSNLLRQKVDVRSSSKRHNLEVLRFLLAYVQCLGPDGALKGRNGQGGRFEKFRKQQAKLQGNQIEVPEKAKAHVSLPHFSLCFSFVSGRLEQTKKHRSWPSMLCKMGCSCRAKLLYV